MHVYAHKCTHVCTCAFVSLCMCGCMCSPVLVVAYAVMAFIQNTMYRNIEIPMYLSYSKASPFKNSDITGVI